MTAWKRESWRFIRRTVNQSPAGQVEFLKDVEVVDLDLMCVLLLLDVLVDGRSDPTLPWRTMA